MGKLRIKKTCQIEPAQNKSHEVRKIVCPSIVQPSKSMVDKKNRAPSILEPSKRSPFKKSLHRLMESEFQRIKQFKRIKASSNLSKVMRFQPHVEVPFSAAC
jgi:hypothetical protein